MNKFKLNPTDIFWMGLSVSTVILSTGVTWSLIRGSSFDVEALNTKFKLSGITSKNRELTRELKQVSEELRRAPLPRERQEELNQIEQKLEQTEKEIQVIEDSISNEGIKNDGEKVPPVEIETNDGS